ncbi:hypothetical protein Val02_37680 [Virgisporangium aliadipatigenens]|uniref:NACHT domain-containing protein n=1 Tax=Virgisporangium aliadipatigenens TaxID=741659 RepID=A0A8J3YM86_9ACTN|nr:NACHT domain-containing protein [Virgisporangium aliadipatigenens]GIJ46882.1 hypothetical protein Val02_37680 [Virgisporangium aliadipatigenens]
MTETFDPSAGAEGLHEELRLLWQARGRPSTRQIAGALDSVSHTSVADALSGRRVPSWTKLQKIVNYLDGDVERFRTLWAGASAPTVSVAEEPAVARFVDQYRQRVLLYHAVMRNPLLNHAARLDFDSVYVHQRVRRAGATTDDPADVVEVLRRERRMVVLGGPGSGKSTMCQALARWAAASGDGPLPFVVRLREFAAETPPARSLAEFIEHQLRVVLQVTPPHNAVERLLNDGRALVLLDGLDELPEVTRRADVVGMIEVFAHAYPAAMILVTSRMGGYAAAPLDPSRFGLCRLDGFDEGEVALFAQRWFAAVGDRATDPAQNHAADFLENSALLTDLRRNPLLLALLCALYLDTGALPPRLVDVYERYAAALFESWDAVSGILERRVGGLRPPLAFLAFWLLTHPDERLTAARAADLVTGYLEAHSYTREDSEEIARELVRWGTGRAGVLTEIGSSGAAPVYGFTHRTFLEYFAAVHLVRESGTPERLAQRLAEHISADDRTLLGPLALQLMDRYVTDEAARTARAMSLGNVVLMVDIEGFGRVSELEHQHLRRTLEQLVREVLADSGIAAGDVPRQEAGDSLIMVLPHSVDIEALVLRLTSVLRKLNAQRDRSARLRIRVAMTTGYVRPDVGAFTGQAAVTASRMVDAPALRQALADRPAEDVVVAVDENLRLSLTGAVPAEQLVPMKDGGTKTETPAPMWLYIPESV